MMKFCRSSLWVLIIVIISTGCESVVTVTGKYKGTAVLPCSGTCSGVISWTPTDKSSDPLAQCNKTSCRSVKEGYQMIHDQYLQGDFSLIIPKADFSKRGWYTCVCGDRDQGDVTLQIETLKSSVQKNAGESLVFELDVPDPVEVIFNSAADNSSRQICTVDRRSLQLSAGYTQRMTSALELMDIKESDSGVYIVRDIEKKEDIHTYNVRVTGNKSVKVKLHESAVLPCSEKCSGVASWTISHKHSDPLVQCNQTSCRSVNEGYQMIHNQYLQGNLSLIIPDADYRKKDWYTCDCDGTDLCHVELLIEYKITSIEIKPGDPLLLDLHLSNAVELMHYSTDSNGSSGQICTVGGCSLKFEKKEYKSRTNVSHVLELRGLHESDSGVYTIRDAKTKETISNYSISVTGDGERSEELHPDKRFTKLSRTVRSAPSTTGGQDSGSSQDLKRGETLKLDVDVLRPVEVIYNSSGANGFSGQICTVKGGSLQCKPEYTQRTSLSSVLELRGMEESDSGIYTVRDNKTKEDIRVYTVSVKGQKDDYHYLHRMVIALVVLIALLVLGFGIWRYRKSVKSWIDSKMKSKMQSGAQTDQIDHSPELESLSPPVNTQK